MKQMMHKYVLVSALLLISSAVLSAQQITKFAVVDTNRVYQAYFRNSAPVRNYESKKAEFQEEIDKQTEDLKDLQKKKLEYEKNGDASNAMKVQSEITKKSEFLNEYANAKNVELETIKNSLQKSDSFYQKLYATLAHIAESEGYSMILSLQQANAILWYSPSVDITDKVISELGL